jgi:hypothetical protein
MLKVVDAITPLAISPLECEELVRGAIHLRVPLSRVEEYLDWLDLVQACCEKQSDIEAWD